MLKVRQFVFVMILLAMVGAGCSGKPGLATPTSLPSPTATALPTNTPTLVPTHTPSPTLTPSPTSRPTDTPTATLTPTSTPTSTPAETGFEVEQTTAGFVCKDSEHGYSVTLPGKNWLLFQPGKDDLDRFFAAAAQVIRIVDPKPVKAWIVQHKDRLRLVAYYTASDVKDDKLHTNMGINTVPIDEKYDMSTVIGDDEKQLTQMFRNSTIVSAEQRVNKHKVNLGLFTIKVPLEVEKGEHLIMAETLIFIKAPDNALVVITFAYPFDRSQELQPVLNRIMNSIVVDNQPHG